MLNESNTPRPNLDLILSTIPEAMLTDNKAHKATERAQIAAIAVYDAAVATFGTARVLTASSRNKDATPDEKAAYTIIKEAAVSAAWSPAFLAKVNNGGAAKQSIGSPSKDHAPNTRFHWQQQKGMVFGRITDRIARAIAQANAQAKASNAAPLGDGAKAPIGGMAAKSPSRKAPIDKRAIEAMGAPMKAMATALAATNGKGEQIPAHIDAPAYLRLCELALLALSPVKEKQNLARLCLAAYDAAMAVDVKAAKVKRVQRPLASAK